MGPNGFNIGPHGPKMGPHGPKMGPHWATWAQIGPTWAQNGPTWAQNGPMWAHMGPCGPTWARAQWARARARLFSGSTFSKKRTFIENASVCSLVDGRRSPRFSDPVDNCFRSIANNAT